MGPHQAAAKQHPLAEHQCILAEQQNPTQMDHLRVAISNGCSTGGLWPGLNASSAQLQMPASQTSRSPLCTLMPCSTPSRLLNSKTSSDQQEQQQQLLVNQAIGLAKPFSSTLTDQFAADLTNDLNRHSVTHTMGCAQAYATLEQIPAGEAAALSAAMPLLPLLDTADFIVEPTCCLMGPSDSSPSHTSGPGYTSCFQQLFEGQAPDDLAIHLCLAAPTTLVIQQAPVCTSEPSASSVIPYTSDHTGNQHTHANEEMPDTSIHSLHSIQPLHSSQPPFFHDHADSSGAQQTVPQAPADAWHQQMLYDMHMAPNDKCFKGTAHDEQPSTTALHMPVQVSSSRGRSEGQEQECPQADPAATGVAAESLNKCVQAMCHSSISTDSRQSCSPHSRSGKKRKRAASRVVDLVEEEGIKVEQRKARNREAARKTRTKRLDAIATLTDQVQSLTCANQELGIQLQQATSQAEFRTQEAKLLRSILMAHAQDLTESENISEKVCSLAKDLLQLLTQNNHEELMGGIRQGFEQPKGHHC